MLGCAEGVAITYRSKGSEGRDMKYYSDFKLNLKQLRMRDRKTHQTWREGKGGRGEKKVKCLKIIDKKSYI